MSISALGGVAYGATVIGAATPRATDFEPQMQALGHGRAAHGRRAEETGTTNASADATPERSMADDARALMGDVFGALGAVTPAPTTARQAVDAYRRAS